MDRDTVIAAYAMVARPFLLRYMDRRSCIASARIARDCLATFGIAATPVAADFRLSVPSMNIMYIAGISTEDKAASQKIARNWVDLDKGEAWNGHLVLTVDDILIDPSFDQALDAVAGIVPSVNADPVTLVLPMDGKSFMPGVSAVFSMSMDDGLVLKADYYGKQDDSYLTTGAWNDEAIRPLTQGVLALMAEHL